MSKRYNFDDPDDALAFTIDQALARERMPPKRSKNEAREVVRNHRMIIARNIVKALKQSNWRFNKRPLARGHSTCWTKKSDV